MNLIDQEPHFWELYQHEDQYYLGIAIDMSSVVSCWDIKLTLDEVSAYKIQGRSSIERMTKKFIDETYRGSFSDLESRKVSDKEKAAMQAAFKLWRENNA
ncbi:hypothetical protein [Acinetobacter stercoris]|uniref:Uncharacterized protein n=1 Tax=Acinetobacter stercoris TaxID=2126983 RepID=A0A2U3N1I3_9GAMM|nr:hypothetical protein [Acinetobacter stercoris]SPL71522.1 hypothetical protein KPC_2700 [Acinetobacter stercoris]